MNTHLAESSSGTSEITATFVRDITPLMAPLYGQALRMTRHHADAEDLLQDTVLSAYTHIQTFRQGTNFRSWLYRIMTNT